MNLHIMNKPGERSIPTDTIVQEDNIFCCVDDMIEEASRIVEYANDIRLFLPNTSRQSREARTVMKKANDWVKTVDDLFESYTPGEALKITDAYDLMHRIAYNQPADKTVINKLILRAFDAMLYGDNDVDQYVLFRAIERRARQREQAFLVKPLTWVFHCLDEWHKQAVKGFDRTYLSDYDVLSRVNLLLDSDLCAFEVCNQQRFKQRLFNQHRHFLSYKGTADLFMSYAISDFSRLSTRFIPNSEL